MTTSPSPLPVLILLVRVLYIINGAEPYILARSHAKVDVHIVPAHPTHTHNDQAIYGKVALRPCLEAICQSRSVSSVLFPNIISPPYPSFFSSPELAPCGSRDFSVYVFDPIESRMFPAVYSLLPRAY